MTNKFHSKIQSRRHFGRGATWNECRNIYNQTEKVNIRYSNLTSSERKVKRRHGEVK